MKRITIAVPEQSTEAMNELALVLGSGPGDAETYIHATWTDGANLYAVCCDVVADDYIDRLTGTLVAPAHAPDADMALAGIARDAIVIGGTASPLHIAVIVGPHDADPMEQVTALGLTAVAQNGIE